MRNFRRFERFNLTMRVISRSVTAIAVGAALAVVGLGAAVPAALASHSQVSIIQDDGSLLAHPAATLLEVRHLGVNMVRVSLRWSLIAPAPNSRRRPKFNASDPNAYPPRNWAPYDAIVRDANAEGIKVLFVLTGFAPVWAQGSNPGRYAAHYSSEEAFKPSGAQFGQFVRAVGTRYSGTFTPPGASSPLPRVSDWELWNEANFGEDLAPQAIDHSQFLYAPTMYRTLVNAGWGALHASGHGRDTILIGALAARGAQLPPGPHRPEGLPGTYGETKPLAFVRALYCLTGSYREDRGASAAAMGCPTTPAGSARFRAQNPALFKASGFSAHPYPVAQPPTQAASADPSYVDFSELPNLASTLDHIQRIYRSSKRFPIWNTEYGYITDPPNGGRPSIGPPGSHWVSPTTAALYLNWAEYLSWRNPRIASTAQYLLYDPNPTLGTPEFGGFSSGLVYFPSVLGGVPKATYYAYRLPIFLPTTTADPGQALEVWGDVRAAPYAEADTHDPQYVQIEFAPGSSNNWSTVATLEVTDPYGYFDTRVVFPGSGQVRIAWTYPPTDIALASTLVTGYIEPLAATTSRVVPVTIK